MAEERWSDLDDERFAFETIPDADPVKLTGAIWNVLTSDVDCSIVAEFVTPESRPSWGDFQIVREAIRREEPLSLISTARQIAGVRDVAYVWLVRPTIANGLVGEGRRVDFAMFFTWVWRQELGGWRLHAIGGQPCPVDQLPRTSPESAPKIDSVTMPNLA